MKSRHLRENLVIAGILIVLLAVFFYDVVFLGKTFKVTTANSQALSYGVYGQRNNRPAFIPVNGTDASVLEEPTYEFIKTWLKKGILPLWNPHQACGFPLIGMLEVGIFFPLNLLIYFLPQLYGWDALIFARFFLAGFLMYRFMRTLRFGKTPSLVSAIVFMLTGPMVLLQYWFVNVDILAPLLLLCLERLIRRPTLPNLSFVALSVGLTFLGGHPEHIFFVNGLGFLFFCFRLFTLRKFSETKKTVVFLIGAYLLGIGLSAIVLFPFLYNLSTQFWINHPPHVGTTTGEVINRVITLAIPYFFQKETLTYDFTFSGWWGGYIGTLPLALAFLALWGKQRKGLNYFFAVLAFLIIGKAYALPIINWIGYLPIFSVCRYYIHTTHLFAFTIAVLAGMGVRTMLAGKHVFNKGLLFSFLLIVITGIYLYYFRQEKHFPLSVQASLFTLGLLITFQSLLLIKDKSWLKTKHIALILIMAVILELFLYIHRERPKRFDSYPSVPYIEFLKKLPEQNRAYGVFWSFYPNTASGYQFDDLGIYFSLLPKRFVSFFNHLVVKDFFKNTLRPPALRVVPIMTGKPFLDLLSLGYIIAPASLTPDKEIFSQTVAKENKQNRLLYAREVNIYRRPDAFPRAFIVHRVIFQPQNELVFETVNGIQDKLRDIAVISHAPVETIEKELSAVPLKDDSTVRIKTYNPNEITIDARLDNAGFLVLSDTFHPDWKAYIDGKQTEVFVTDHLIRSVFLPAGAHQVRFVFLPFSFILGAYLSGTSLLLILLLLIRKQK